MNLQEATQAYATDHDLAEKAQQSMQSLLARSATDAAFRTKLLTNPRAAFAEFNGVELSAIPESLNVRFVENKADATVVLPDPIRHAAELSDSELEAVAGGSEAVLITIGAVTAVAIIVDCAIDAYQAGKKAAANTPQ